MKVKKINKFIATVKRYLGISNRSAGLSSKTVSTYGQPYLLDKSQPMVSNLPFSISTSIQTNGRFRNPWKSFHPLGFVDCIKFMMAKDRSNLPNKDHLDSALPIRQPDFQPPIDGVKLTWLGHSTLLVQLDGLTLLTDPIFSARASPLQWIGPKRYRPTPCSLHALPSTLDAVVLSHNHYDHLDRRSVEGLHACFGKQLTWFVPLGLAAWLYKAGIRNVVELDWWQAATLPNQPDVAFVCTPAQHWSTRGFNDYNKSLWGSWAIIGPKHRFFFAGDTGYCPAFKEIGHLYGPFTAAAIPIGAYEPRWFMQCHHINPEEAVAIHEDIQSHLSVAIHWGTFPLGNHYYLAPRTQLKDALDKKKIASFVTLNHGESRLIQSQ